MRCGGSVSCSMNPPARTDFSSAGCPEHGLVSALLRIRTGFFAVRGPCAQNGSTLPLARSLLPGLWTVTNRPQCFSVSCARHARRDGMRPPPAEYAVDRRPFCLFGRLSPTHLFFHGGKNLQDDPKRELGTLPARAKGKGERVCDASWSPRRIYVRVPGSPTRVGRGRSYPVLSLPVPWMLCRRAALIITPQYLSPLLFVRPALLCRSLCPPTNPPTHAAADPLWLGSTSNSVDRNARLLYLRASTATRTRKKNVSTPTSHRTPCIATE
jgi:hypothetical protein